MSESQWTQSSARLEYWESLSWGIDLRKHPVFRTNRDGKYYRLKDMEDRIKGPILI